MHRSQKKSCRSFSLSKLSWNSAAWCCSMECLNLIAGFSALVNILAVGLLGLSGCFTPRLHHPLANTIIWGEKSSFYLSSQKKRGGNHPKTPKRVVTLQCKWSWGFPHPMYLRFPRRLMIAVLNRSDYAFYAKQGA